MPQNQVRFTVPNEWAFLEPAIDPSSARTMHGVLKPAASGQTITYTAGQVVCQKDDASNSWAKLGTSGYTGRRRLVKYTITMDENGNWQYGSAFINGQDTFENSVALYYSGKFKAQELLPAGLTDDATAITVGAFISGNRTAGILDLALQSRPA